MTYNLQTNMLYDFYMRIEISLRANNQLELKSIQFDVYQTCNTFCHIIRIIPLLIV